MAKLSILAGSTSQSVNIFIQDSSVTTGAGLTGLVFNTGSLTAYYTFAGTNATATTITLATLAAVNSAYSSGGFKEIDATNMPGVYRLDIPNAALAISKGRSVVIILKGAANMAPCLLEIELTAVDNQLTSYGLTLAKTTNITGFNDISAAGAATGVWQDTTAGDFTVPGSIGKSLFTSGNSPGAAGGLFIAGTNAATTVTTALTTTFTGNLTGSVGSVTGNVGGNVTGSVGSVVAAVAITSNRKKGATATFEFLMQDSITGAPKTGLTVASTISKDGGGAASTTNAVTEIGLGQYQIVLTAAEMTMNNGFLQFIATGAITYSLSIQTQP